MKIAFLNILMPVLLAGSTKAQDECYDGFMCSPYSDCDRTRSGDGVLFPCSNGICCPVKSTSRTSPTDIFPQDCGETKIIDRVIGGVNASIGQFPWMALLGFKTRGIDIVQFLCGGSVIHENYVLTAAHCLTMSRLELAFVRLGELDLKRNVDCETYFNKTTCADPHIDVPVSKAIIHEHFNSTTLKNDIALIKLNARITFTEYIHPICLPFSYGFDPNAPKPVAVTVSGWGKIHTDNLGGATHLQFAALKIWNETQCSNFVKPSVATQICASGPKGEDSCKGDSGGPIFNSKSVGPTLRSFQLGIVSYLPVIVCGGANVPSIYTRVDQYLEWIVDKVIQ